MARVVIDVLDKSQSDKYAIKYCEYVKAVEQPDSFEDIAHRFRKSIRRNRFHITPCEHDNMCRALSDEEHEAMFNRAVQSMNILYRFANGIRRRIDGRW